MPRGNYRTIGIDNRGYGSQGFCKLCSFKDARFQLSYDERTRAGWTPRNLNEWAEKSGQAGAVASKETIYNHRKHVQHPKDRIVSAVQRTEARTVATTKPEASPDVFLEAIVSIGQQRAIDNPEEVTIDHALRAAQALKQSKSQSSGINILIAAMTGISDIQATVIDGEAVEV